MSKNFERRDAPLSSNGYGEHQHDATSRCLFTGGNLFDAVKSTLEKLS